MRDTLKRSGQQTGARRSRIFLVGARQLQKTRHQSVASASRHSGVDVPQGRSHYPSVTRCRHNTQGSRKGANFAGHGDLGTRDSFQVVQEFNDGLSGLHVHTGHVIAGTRYGLTTVGGNIKNSWIDSLIADENGRCRRRSILGVDTQG